MKVTIRQTCIRTIKSTDPKFHITDGYVVAPRAGFEIDSRCPKEYKLILQECISYGWIKPIANIKDNELFWERLEQ